MIRTLQFVEQQVLRLAFSSDKPIPHDAPLFLIAGGSPNVAVYDVSNPRTPPNTFQVYQGHSEAITAVGFEPKHTAFAFSASEDGTLQTWLPQLAAHQMPQNPHQDPNLPPHYVVPTLVHPMAAGAYRSNGAMRFNSVPATMDNTGPHGLAPIHDAVYFPPADLFFTADFYGRLRIWDHKTSSLLSTILPHPSKRNLQCLELSADHTILAMANFDGRVFIYNIHQLLTDSSKAVPVTFRANDGYIPRIRLSFNISLLVCTTCSGAIKVFRMPDILNHCNSDVNEADDQGRRELPQDDANAITPVREFIGHLGSIWDAAFVEDRDDYLFTCSSNSRQCINNNRQVMLWALDDIDNSTQYTGHQKGVVCMAVREKMSPGVTTEQFGTPPMADQAVQSNGSPSVMPTNVDAVNQFSNSNMEHPYDVLNGPIPEPPRRQ